MDINTDRGNSVTIKGHDCGIELDGELNIKCIDG